MKIKTGFFTLVLLVTGFFSLAQDVKYKMVVALDGSGDFTSIQSAIEATKAFPDKRITIYIKNGVYREKVRIPSWNTMLSIIGEDVEKTVIIWDDFFKGIDKGRNSTFMTYTFEVDADDFIAENLTIVNAAGEVGQAVALHSEGNRCTFKNCRFLGNQDTVYLDGENSHQCFIECYIEGTTDFIFGSATVLFRRCTISAKRDSYITAASTTPGRKFGFVFDDCDLTATDNTKNVYLGRPWRPYARVVFMNSRLGSHINPQGWHNWNTTEASSTAFYAEYNNTGPGADTANRVAWAYQLTKEEAEGYKPELILGEWISSLPDK